MTVPVLIPRRLIVVAAMALALFGVISAPSFAQTGNLSANASSSFGCGKYMASTATYVRGENKIVGSTRLDNNCQLAGFHGAVVPLLTNSQGELVGYGDPKRYGIDGRGPCYPVVVSWWPFRTETRCPPTATRVDNWTDYVDVGAAGEATTLTLYQYAAPNSWLESLQSLRAHLAEGVAIGKSVGEIIAIINAL
jgi:hypothetical protein